MLLAIDPGETSGLALFQGNGKPFWMEQARGAESLHKFLMGIEKDWGSVPDTVVIELYRVLPTQHSIKANVGSKLKTVEAIGIVKSFCMTWDAKVVEQEPSIKNIAKKWTNIKVPSNHKDSHQFDALLHGYYYLIKSGALDPRQVASL